MQLANVLLVTPALITAGVLGLKRLATLTNVLGLGTDPFSPTNSCNNSQ